MVSTDLAELKKYSICSVTFCFLNLSQKKEEKIWADQNIAVDFDRIIIDEFNKPFNDVLFTAAICGVVSSKEN